MNKESNILITDILGRTIKNESIPPSAIGINSWNWNGLNNKGQNVSSGVYIVTISSGSALDFRKVSLIK
jgi:flagellar hook assembly protein FlgD